MGISNYVTLLCHDQNNTFWNSLATQNHIIAGVEVWHTWRLFRITDLIWNDAGRAYFWQCQCCEKMFIACTLYNNITNTPCALIGNIPQLPVDYLKRKTGQGHIYLKQYMSTPIYKTVKPNLHVFLIISVGFDTWTKEEHPESNVACKSSMVHSWVQMWQCTCMCDTLTHELVFYLHWMNIYW